jgi:nicotinamidase-related amidase
MSLQFDVKRCALLLIDLQNDFLADDGAYARGGLVSDAARELPTRLAPLAQAVKRCGGMVLASRFTLWPDATGEPMIAAQLRTLRPFLRRGDFQSGGRGHAVVDALHALVDVAVDKVAYSAFFDTQLDWVLRHAGIEHLVVGGIVTHGGVASTARDAHVREYHVSVLADGCAAFDVKSHDNALADLHTMARVLRCDEMAALLPRPD